jgi:hypothetical protein
VRKMPNEEWFIDRHVFVRVNRLSWFALKNTINQQKRITVRQVFQDLMNIH